MRSSRQHIPIFAPLLGVLLSSAFTIPSSGAVPTYARPAAEIPLCFRPNLGQTSAAVSFVGSAPGVQVFLEGGLSVWSLVVPGSNTVSGRTIALAMELEGVDSSPRPVGGVKVPGRCDYFLGSDPSRWVRNVPAYSDVLTQDIYPGIDLSYHGRGRNLEYDYTIREGADYHRIHWRFKGAQETRLLANGDLAVRLAGSASFELRRPECRVEREGRSLDLAGSFVRLSNGSYAFNVPDYDGKGTLVIDPVVVPPLAYSTYLGGSGQDMPEQIIADALGDAYVCGYSNGAFGTAPADFGTIGSSSTVGFVCELDPSGSTLLYSAFFGASGDVQVEGIGINGGNIYVAGQTASGFPVHAAAQASYGGGTSDAFLAEINPSSSGGLVFATYLGGASADNAYALAVDSSGNAYIGGATGSGFPTTSGAAVPDFSGIASNEDFLAKFSQSGTLDWATYVGGNFIDGVALDPEGNAYVTGMVSAGTGVIPTTTGSFQPTQPTGDTSGYAVKFLPSGSIGYATYFGTAAGSIFDYEIAADSSGCAYLVGNTNVGSLPLAGTPILSGMPSGASFASFFTKLNASGSALLYSTYLWETGIGTCHAVAVDAGGNAYLTGYTNGGFPTTTGALQASIGSNQESYLVVFGATGSTTAPFSLSYCTYLGSTITTTHGFSVAVDPSANIYLTGFTDGAYPTTAGAYESSFSHTPNSGVAEGYVTKFGMLPSPSASPSVTPALSPTLSPTLSPAPSLTATPVLSATPALTAIPTLSPFLLSPLFPYPDPAGPEGVSLPFTITQDAFVDCIIYNVAGEKIRTWSDDPQWTPQGARERFWDETNSYGKSAASGVYMVRIRARSALDGSTQSVWGNFATIR